MKLNFTKTITAFTVLILLFCLEGCSSAAPTMPEDPIRFRKETAKKGLIIGSITFPKLRAGHTGYFLNIVFESADEKLVKKNSVELHLEPEEVGLFHMEHRGQMEGGLTYLFAVERPEGNYAISSIRLLNNVNTVVTFNQYVKDFSIPFTVKKGEITYVGNILYNEHKEKGTEGYAVNLKSRFAIDIANLKRIQPLTDWRMAIDRKEYTITRQEPVVKE